MSDDESAISNMDEDDDSFTTMPALIEEKNDNNISVDSGDISNGAFRQATLLRNNRYAILSNDDSDTDDISNKSTKSDDSVSITSGNDMTSHVLNNIHVENSINNGEPNSDNKKYIIASSDMVLAYVNKVSRANHGSKHIQINQAKVQETDWELLRKRFGWLPIDILKNTWETTTQLAKMDV